MKKAHSRASIRSATPDDIPGLARLLSQLFAQEAEFQPDTTAQVRGLAAIVKDPRIGRILVAEQEGDAVGMANLLYTISTALGGPVAILEDVVVDGAHRGHGIGTALMTAAIERSRADGCLRVTLLTDHDNRRAHSFYEGFGFTRSPMVPFRLALSRTLAA